MTSKVITTSPQRTDNRCSALDSWFVHGSPFSQRKFLLCDSPPHLSNGRIVGFSQCHQVRKEHFLCLHCWELSSEDRVLAGSLSPCALSVSE